MRSLLFSTAVVLTGMIVSPASAQMCGGGQNATQAQAGASGGMCGMMAKPAPAAGQEQAQAQLSSGCSCCQHMAMMKPPAGGQGTSPVPQDPMPNMQMPAPDASGTPPAVSPKP